MALNRIQFQCGPSMHEFLKCYGTEAQCTAALVQARWPTGYRCERCDGATYIRGCRRTHQLFQCQACRHQASLIVGAMLQGAKLSLGRWFHAIYLIIKTKAGRSVLALRRPLRVSYPTAWLMLHKLMQAVAKREECYVLDGEVQLGDAYLGGERSGGKIGQGAENKAPFVVVISLRGEGHLQRTKLTPFSGFDLNAVGHWKKTHQIPDSTVFSGGPAPSAAVTAAGCTHQPIVVGGRKPKDLPELKWIYTVLGNLKSSLSGSYYAFDFRKHAARCLAAFSCRFNCRFDVLPACKTVQGCDHLSIVAPKIAPCC